MKSNPQAEVTLVTENHIQSQLSSLFRLQTGKTPKSIQNLPASGSVRQYYRLLDDTHSLIGVFNEDVSENRTFIEFSKHFRKSNIQVPEVYTISEDGKLYLQEDLGDLSLLSYLLDHRREKEIPEEVLSKYEMAVEGLAKIQTVGGEGLDYSLCLGGSEFKEQAYLWDLNYFKYYFLKAENEVFDEHLLEQDFHSFAKFLNEAPAQYFLFRDFQARNIQLHDKKVWFIDFQGGKKGALQYDLASLLYQARADLPELTRIHLIQHYLKALSQYIEVDKEVFMRYFYGFVLIRCLQTLGSYGYRGFFQRKPHFLKSIPFALHNLGNLLEKHPLPIEVPHLKTVLNALSTKEQKYRRMFETPDSQKLTVTIKSFSYKRGIPDDISGHGGGFVFDCRSLNNPGRYEPYKKLTGRDETVIAFLQNNSSIDTFLGSIYNLVEPAVEQYLSRGFDHLMVSFGCTGGQHRSVYSADALARQLETKYDIIISLEHVEQELKGWKN